MLVYDKNGNEIDLATKDDLKKNVIYKYLGNLGLGIYTYAEFKSAKFIIVSFLNESNNNTDDIIFTRSSTQRGKNSGNIAIVSFTSSEIKIHGLEDGYKFSSITFVY